MILAEAMLLLTILMKTEAKIRKSRWHLRETLTQKQSRGTGKKGQLKTCT